MTVLLIALALGTPAFAQDEADTDGQEASDEGSEAGEGEAGQDEAGQDEADTTGEPVEFDLSGAVEAPELDRETYQDLKPTRGKLPPNPYGQVDYTAYALEWGEVKAGITNLQMGVLPRVQLGTSPALMALRVMSINGKVDAVRAGPVDLAVTARYTQLPQANFTGSAAGGGLGMSAKLTPGWSVHGGVSGDMITVGGLPDPTRLPAPLISNTEADLQAWYDAAQAEGLRFDLSAMVVNARFATDVRFNRRDSLVLQAQAMVWHDVMAGVSGVEELPPVLGIDEWLAVDTEGGLPVTDTYAVSLAYQATWKHVDLRVGIGTSAVPGTWLLQAMELSYRFGGKTRSEERRIRKGWRENRDELGA